MPSQAHRKNANPDKTKISAMLECKSLVMYKAQHLAITVLMAGTAQSEAGIDETDKKK